MLFSIHPRTKNNIVSNNIDLSENIVIMDSLPYLEFLNVMKNAKVIFTDSGGIQEESTVLKIPCYTLRENTERPITISQGTNRLISPNRESIINSFNNYRFNINSNYNLPEGWDGKASERIVKFLDKIIRR